MRKVQGSFTYNKISMIRPIFSNETKIQGAELNVKFMSFCHQVWMKQRGYNIPCSNCGAEMPSDVKFCTICGSKVLGA